MPLLLGDIVHDIVAPDSRREPHSPKVPAQDASPHNGAAPVSPIISSPGSPNINSRKSVHSRRSTHSYKGSPALTPATRTGPPRSLSYTYNQPRPTSSSRSNSGYENGEIQEVPITSPQHATTDEEDPYAYDYTPRESHFRGALEYTEAEKKERERDIAERRGKRKDTSIWDDWKSKWRPEHLTDSPHEEKQAFSWESQEGRKGSQATADDSDRPVELRSASPSHQQPSSGSRIVRSISLPHKNSGGAEKEKDDGTSKSGSTTAKWNRLRFLIPTVTSQAHKEAQSSTVAPTGVNITDELIAGGLSTLMLRLWFERDEKDRRRVPVLLHRLRIRISDSLHPLHGTQSVFRIECEYANGAARWVVYRQLRDFLSLHTHYAVSNAYNRNVDNLPEFPRTSLPYFKFLKKESREKGGEVKRADFARLQREALEDYLIGLVRAVMFHPASNRLAGFLEISALSISLAQSGGAQYKAGYLRVEAVTSNKPSGFGRRAASRREKREQKWCSIRESYLVAVDEPGQTSVWDVFMLDPDFKIERPMRYYRQGLHLLQGEQHERQSEEGKDKGHGEEHTASDRVSLLGSIRSRFSKVLHPHHANGTVERSSASTRPSDLTRPSDVTRPRSNSTASSSSSSASSHPPTPMLDPSTNTNPLMEAPSKNQAQDEGEKTKKKKKSSDVSKHTFYIENSQTRLKLYAKSERQMLQWIAALERVAATSHYTGRNRFDSFSPIRLNVAAQWLVDGRDYFWNLSRAILLARDVIYIHDWWLSPELQLRRPGKPKYRLDRLLERKAKEGIKVFIIVYQEVSNRTTPTDSNYTKQRMTLLHPNIMVQRSPSHFQTGTFYWAHHEKLCVIDETIAFMGGLDLCFGRWDTSQHVLTDDPGDEGAEEIWPGKDYSNGRMNDFHTLNKPEEDMHDRTRIPRMPWHDVGLQVLGQPARDVARHFVQRWNYLLRIKNHSRVMPFLLPPPEFKPGELGQLGLTGTCEMQICRSAGPWSLGTPDRIEHSIQNAYLKAIQMSEHFVYIENQFFISSTVVGDVTVENKIGDAIVHRIIRAHREGVPWKCCVVIPLLPGFPFPVDHTDASSVRIILECQNRTICRGPNSIFARLRRENIDPDNYFTVFSLRNWGKLRGDVLTSELVYIHGKVCIVDDRLVIIGSANINERSQRGDRDSEIAAIIRDTDMIDGSMAGKPFKVGRFAHTLRVRLMREHVGVDVDAIDEQDMLAKDTPKGEHQQHEWDPDAEQEYGREDVTAKKPAREGRAMNFLRFGGEGVKQVVQGSSDVGSKDLAEVLQKTGISRRAPEGFPDARAGNKSLQDERQTFTRDGEKVPGFTSSVVPTLEEQMIMEHRPSAKHAYGSPIEEDIEKEAQEDAGASSGDLRDETGLLYGAPADAQPGADDQPPHASGVKNDADTEEKRAPHVRSILRRHLGAKLGQNPWTLPTPTPKIDPDGFEDPVCDAFWKDVWVASAVHNTEIFRRVFHAIPDDLVATWKQYTEFVAHHERLNKPARDGTSSDPVARVPSEAGDMDAPEEGGEDNAPHDDDAACSKTGSSGDDKEQSVPNGQGPSEKGKKAEKGEPPFTRQEREEMESLLRELCGHLVLYPTRFLEGEDIANNFLFNADRLMPMPIYD